MILANGSNPQGRPIVLIGLTADEIVDLMGRKELRIDGDDVGYPVEFIVVAASTDDALIGRLQREGVLTDNSIQRPYTGHKEGP